MSITGHMPSVGDTVRILKGVYAGKLGIVQGIDDSQWSSIAVTPNNFGLVQFLTPDEVEIFSGI
jgi:transcription antitermination factor NusG